jgi:hypothetical protein
MIIYHVAKISATASNNPTECTQLPLQRIPALFFEVDVELGDPTFVVVTVETVPGIVLPSIVVPLTVFSGVVEGISEVTTNVSCSAEPEIVVVIVSGYKSVSVPTIAGIVEAGIVVPSMVVPGKVVVYVSVTRAPNALVGIAGCGPADV